MLKRNKSSITSNGSFLEVLKIALPLILSQSCRAVNMFTDRLMLSRYSQDAAAASFTGGLTNFTLVCIFVGTIGYTGTFVAQYEGARHRERIGSAVWQGIYMALLGALFVVGFTAISNPLFETFKHDVNITKLAVEYFDILCIGCFVFLMNLAISSFWTGRGKTNFVLVVSVIVTILNIPFNYFAIFGCESLNLASYGTKGAAVATILAEGVGLVIYFIAFLSKNTHRHFNSREIKIDFPLLKRMLKFGLPNGIHLAIDLIGFNTFSLLLGRYGADVHAASAVSFGIHTIAFCPIIGVGMTVAILVGQGVGAQDIPLAKKGIKNSSILIIIYSILMVMLFTVFQNIIIEPFECNKNASKLAGVMLYLISVYLCFNGAVMIFSNVLRGAGDTKFPMWTMSVVGICCFAIPCVILYSCGFPWWSLWIAFNIEFMLLAIVFYLRYRQGKWTKMKVIELEANKNAIAIEE